MENQWNNNSENNEENVNGGAEFSQNNDSFGAGNDTNGNTYGSDNGENQYNPNEYAFNNVIDGKHKSMGWSVASMVVGIVSVVCCCLGWSGLILGTMAIVLSVVSRKSLGYFDGMSIAGLVLGIFGFVFGVSLLVGNMIMDESFWQSFMEEFEAEFNNGTIPGTGGDI
jgi:hypothetical protein